MIAASAAVGARSAPDFPPQDRVQEDVLTHIHAYASHLSSAADPPLHTIIESVEFAKAVATHAGCSEALGSHSSAEEILAWCVFIPSSQLCYSSVLCFSRFPTAFGSWLSPFLVLTLWLLTNISHNGQHCCVHSWSVPFAMCAYESTGRPMQPGLWGFKTFVECVNFGYRLEFV